MPQTRQKVGPKERITLSLEKGTVQFLQSCAKAKASSVSACVEQIIASSRQTSSFHPIRLKRVLVPLVKASPLLRKHNTLQKMERRYQKRRR